MNNAPLINIFVATGHSAVQQRLRNNSKMVQQLRLKGTMGLETTWRGNRTVSIPGNVK